MSPTTVCARCGFELWAHTPATEPSVRRVTRTACGAFTRRKRGIR